MSRRGFVQAGVAAGAALAVPRALAAPATIEKRKLTLGLGIQKTHGANDVKVGLAVRDFIAKFDKELAVTDPDMSLYVSFDSTKFTGEASGRCRLNAFTA